MRKTASWRRLLWRRAGRFSRRLRCWISHVLVNGTKAVESGALRGLKKAK